MRGMILAGGLSTRLYPLTLDVPKPLVPVLDRPVVGHVIDYLVRSGVDDLAINVHYFADAVEAYVGDGSAFNATMTYSREPALTGSAGAVKALARRFRETFVVIGCDDVTNIDLPAAIDFHRHARAEATIVLVEAVDVGQYGVVVVDGDGRITEFQEKPTPGTERSHLVNTGVYIFEPALLDRIPADTFYDFGKQVFPEMLSAGARFYATQQRAYWCDIGTPREYRRAHLDALNGVVSLATSDGAVIRDRVLSGRGAIVEAGAAVIGPCCVGAGARIARGARVERSILWRGVVVESGARVTDAVLGEGARVEPGVTVTGGEYARSATLTA